MKLFPDTAGITTHPPLLAKEKGDFRANLKRTCELVDDRVSGEVIATDFADIGLEKFLSNRAKLQAVVQG